VALVKCHTFFFVAPHELGYAWEDMASLKEGGVIL